MGKTQGEKMIRLISVALFLIVSQRAHAIDLARVETLVKAHLDIKTMNPDAGVRMATILDAVCRGDANKLSDFVSAIYRHREGLYGLRDKSPHPFEQIDDPRVRAFMELLVMCAADLLTHQKRCEADFLNWYKDIMIYGLGRKRDQACEERMLKEMPPGTYTGGYHDYVYRKCYEASANPAERGRLINDFAFIMDRLLFLELVDVFSDVSECPKPK